MGRRGWAACGLCIGDPRHGVQRSRQHGCRGGVAARAQARAGTAVGSCGHACCSVPAVFSLLRKGELWGSFEGHRTKYDCIQRGAAGVKSHCASTHTFPASSATRTKKAALAVNLGEMGCATSFGDFLCHGELLMFVPLRPAASHTGWQQSLLDNRAGKGSS